MLGLPTLDVAIGVAFFYLIFSLICTTANEAIARWLKKRPRTLEEAIHQLLGNADLENVVLNHPLICNLSRSKPDKTKGGRELPSYIPAASFATALLDLFTGKESIRELEPVRKALTTGDANGGSITTQDGKSIRVPRSTQIALKTLLDRAGGDSDRFHAEIESWYNATMDRAQGWYKRYIQRQTYILAAAIVLWADFDTLQVVRRLWTDSALRTVVVEQARGRVNLTNSGELPLATYENPEKPDQGKPIQVEHTGASSPLTEGEQALVGDVTGWGRDLGELRSALAASGNAADGRSKSLNILIWVLMHIFGWSISLLAISLGAPFWFDVLNRFMNLRNAGRAPDEPRAKNAGGAKATAEAQ